MISLAKILEKQTNLLRQEADYDYIGVGGGLLMDAPQRDMKEQLEGNGLILFKRLQFISNQLYFNNVTF